MSTKQKLINEQQDVYCDGELVGQLSDLLRIQQFVKGMLFDRPNASIYSQNSKGVKTYYYLEVAAYKALPKNHPDRP
jgi:hypothetical protein